MMFNERDQLLIFESFRIDRRLLKFLQPKKARQKSRIIPGSMDMAADSDSEDGMDEATFNIISSAAQGRFTIRDERVFVSGQVQGRSRRWRWPWQWWKAQQPQQSPEMSVLDFFKSVKDSTAQVEIVAERAKGYEEAIVKADKAGQTAFKEVLVKRLASVRAETQLAAMGLGKYVEEASVVAFAKKSPKAIRLDWIENFIRPIPDVLMVSKKDADARFIFDNYVVMHHDPSGKSWAETQAERDKRENDPILFGVMEGSRRLYYVGDWVDDFCDLTLDQVADTIGKEAIKHV